MNQKDIIKTQIPLLVCICYRGSLSPLAYPSSHYFMCQSEPLIIRRDTPTEASLSRFTILKYPDNIITRNSTVAEQTYLPRLRLSIPPSIFPGVFRAPLGRCERIAARVIPASYYPTTKPLFTAFHSLRPSLTHRDKLQPTGGIR